MNRRTATLILSLASLSAAVIIAGKAFAQAVFTHEVLVLASAPTLIVRTANTSAFELQNLGPNAIWCGLGGDAGVAVVNKSHKIDSLGGTWSGDTPPSLKTWCIAQGADQITGGATVVSERAP
jgi:hypothetical protein